ncbi:MAG: T9SS type A sorting domain-containing protein, partial [Aureispira sp.]|nr:T9SS type A sorting domain-containing protein [Aureispira sp.]
IIFSERLLTTINNTLYHQVQRTGSIYEWNTNMGYMTSSLYDLQGFYHFRVEGDSLLVLDTIFATTNTESVLYNFAQQKGDTIFNEHLNLIDLTNRNTPFNFLNVNASPTDYWLIDSTNTFSNSSVTFNITCKTTTGYSSNYPSPSTIAWEKGIGTIYHSNYMGMVTCNCPIKGGYDYFLYNLTTPTDTLFNYPSHLLTNVERVASVKSDIKVYPNPASQYTIIDATNIKAIQVYNSLGKLFLEFNTDAATKKHELDLTTLTSGSYFIKFVQTNNTVAIKPLIFQSE